MKYSARTNYFTVFINQHTINSTQKPLNYRTVHINKHTIKSTQ